MNGVVKTVLVLTLIAFFAGLSLGLVYGLTAKSDSLPDKKALVKLVEASDYKELKLNGETKLEFGTIKCVCVPVDNNGVPVADSVIFLSDGNGGFDGAVSMLVYIKNAKVENIICYENSETPGVGSNALTDKYLKRYIGQDVSSDFELKNSGNDYWSKPVKQSGHEDDASQIEGYTGATRTSTAVVNALSAIHTYYVNNLSDLTEQINELK